MEQTQDISAVLQWHIDAGCDECVADEPVDRFAVSAVAPAPEQGPAPTASASAASRTPAQNAPAISRGAKIDPREVDNNRQVKSAMELAAAAQNIDDLREALTGFDGCPLKKTATNLVLSDGPADARLMFVGEAPGADEDRQGVPFVGPSGKLLNAILESAGLKREDVLISNTVFWRPPGNRTPTTQESAVCHPFIERLVEIVDPAVLVCVGAPAAHTMLGQTQGISRLRGKWFSFQTPKLSHPINATAMFHPAYLLRTPIKKRDAWADIRMIRKKLDDA
ncbi:uracil-DNA glycosylase [Thalassospiraceae bacterium LMO-JJ14]|nr:uracil-DNA glycosylase [Thalassospiraceae bacterium LMO-JJ14]